MSHELSISYSSLIRIFFVLLAFIFLYLIRDILILLFLSIVLTSALEPWVGWYEKHHMPRGVGVIAIYVILFATISLVGVALFPAIKNQAEMFSKNFPEKYAQLADKWNLPESPFVFSQTGTNKAFSDTITSVFDKAIPALSSFFGGSMRLFLLLVLTFYLSVDQRNLKRFLRSLFPDKYQPYFNRVVNRMQNKMGLWFRGQLFLSFIIFLLTAVALFFVHMITGGIPFWLVLAVIAGILEVIPFVGPFVAGAIAVILALSHSLLLAGVVALVYIIIQQLENHLLVPKIMQKAVGLNPIIIILVIVIGGRLAGVMGALVAIPIAAAAHVLIQDVMHNTKTVNTRQG